MPQTMADLFQPDPEQWGLRGDPHAWAAMRERLTTTPIPEDTVEVTRLLTDAFASVVGVDITQARIPKNERQVYREEFAHGGMSSGVVDVEWWKDRFIPLLVSRVPDKR